MTENKYIIISMDDPKTKHLADVLGNKTSKKIIDYLAEHSEASEKDIVDALRIPASTVEYNIGKLLKSGFVEKKKNFFWSKKGKKIVMYELSNKSILISPNRGTSEKLKSLLPGFILTLTGTFAVWVFDTIKSGNIQNNVAQDYVIQNSQKMILENVPELSNGMSNVIQANAVWGWFLSGGILALLIFAIVNWRKL